MTYVAAGIALFKYLFILGFFISVGWALLKEHDPKNKIIEIVVGIILIAMALGLPKLIVNLAGSNSQSVSSVVDTWDISPLYGGSN
jgi:hypothetical protein